jgi:hypothetical protein
MPELLTSDAAVVKLLMVTTVFQLLTGTTPTTAVAAKVV